VRTDFGYDVVFTATKADHGPLVAFRRWIHREAKDTRENVERLLADPS
jgi:hypothetical protein